MFNVPLLVQLPSDKVDTTRSGAFVSPNIAIHVFMLLITTFSGLAVPEQSPDQPVKVEPESATAVTTAISPLLYVPEPLTVPLPVPELPEVIVIHESLLVAVQEPEQALGEAVTVTLPVPPLAPND